MNENEAVSRLEPRWWGWGDPSVSTELPEKVRSLLASKGLESDGRSGPPELAEVRIPEAKPLPAPVAQAAGPFLRVDPESRIRHSGGHSLPDLLERRSGSLGFAPDAVISPPDEASLSRVIEACRDCMVGVVPWGGGTSVTGGLRAADSGFEAVVALDMKAFNDFEIDPISMTARLGAGLRGPEVENHLQREGFTLGHFPQSFEFASIGGFAAARSAGQSSSGYGRFDEMVTSVKLVAPAGVISTIATPKTSSGPSVREMVLGSEGALGVITEVGVRVHPVPAISRYEGWLVSDFAAGCEAVRRLAQAGRLPSLIRISDEIETGISIGMSKPEGLPGSMLDAWIRVRGRSEGSLVIVGFEGDSSEVDSMRRAARTELEAAGGIRLGQRAGRGWSSARFHGPYLREGLLDIGLIVETFETSAAWSVYGSRYRQIRDRTVREIESNGMRGVLMCHLSHAYPDSASLYFTVIASPGPAGPVESWRAVKQATLEQITSAGLAVSHHHGVGRDHAAMLEAELGEVGLAALLALKNTLDPTGIMNPGCLLPRQLLDRRKLG